MHDFFFLNKETIDTLLPVEYDLNDLRKNGNNLNLN